MCLIAWHWQPGAQTPLILLSNRDEFYVRPSAPLHWWGAGPADVLAGRDLQGGGTWLGLSRSGRLAALTNVRTAEPANPAAPSRGELVRGFLQSTLSAHHFAEQIIPHATRYNPFNVLLFDGTALIGLHSRDARVTTLAPGLGAVSNATFDTPWPKLVHLKRTLQHQLQTGPAAPMSLMPLLQHTALAPDAALPATGVPLALERALSAVFVTTPSYGTRASSVICLQRDRAEFVEHSFNAQGHTGQVCESFYLTCEPV